MKLSTLGLNALNDAVFDIGTFCQGLDASEATIGCALYILAERVKSGISESDKSEMAAALMGMIGDYEAPL